MQRTNPHLLAFIALAATLTGCATDASPEPVEAPMVSTRSTSTAINGLPFRLAPGVKVAGYGLNTNDDGIQNFGELAVDCGGAGPNFCADTIPLEIHIDKSKTKMLSFNGFDTEYTTGTLNGRTFQMLRPLPHPALTGTRFGIVAELPTRAGNDHEPPETDPIEKLFFGQQSGAIAIAISGVTGGHPYAFSAQEAVLASRYLREVHGVERVLTSGFSYGGATSTVELAAHPEFFDGVVSQGAPYNISDWMAGIELEHLHQLGGGSWVPDPVYYGGLDGIRMTLGQAGLDFGNLDLTQAENNIRPATFVLGEVDGVWLPGNQPSIDRARMLEDGVTGVEILVAPEEGHGGPRMNAETFNAFEPIFEAFHKQDHGTLVPPARAPLPYVRSTRFDETIRQAPTIRSAPGVREVWSEVNQIEGGHMAGAVLATADATFAGSLQGFVTRRDATTGDVEWSEPVGRVVQGFALANGQLVVGSKRGLTLLDASTGAITRESLNIGSVHDVVVADIIPEEAGLEIAARTDMNRLHVESLASGEIYTSVAIGTGGAMTFGTWRGEDALLVPLRAGHLAAFTFEGGAAGYIPVAQWLSPYLASDLKVVRLIDSGTGPQLITGGTSYGEGRNPSLFIVDQSDDIAAIDVSSQLATVNTIAGWNGNTVLIAGLQRGRGGERAIQVDLGTETVVRFAEDVSNLAIIDDGERVAVWSRGTFSAPSMRHLGPEGGVMLSQIGRATTPALDVFVDASLGIAELSVLSSDWEIERFDLLTGDFLGAIQYPNIVGPNRKARGLARTSPVTAVSSYAPFLSDGVAVGPLRVATRCGRWVVSDSLTSEQGSLFSPSHSDERTATCALFDWGAPALVPPPAAVRISEPLGEPLALSEDSDVALANLLGELTILLSSPGGQVARYPASSIINTTKGDISPTASHDVAGTFTTLAANETQVVVGSYLPDDDGNTVHILAADAMHALHAFDAGHVLGVALADVNEDGIDDILTGTVDGWLRAYDLSGEMIFEWSAGDLSVGENGALFAVNIQGRTLVVAAVAGGWRVIEIG